MWLCHFANSEINNYFNTKVNELAPWINNLIEIFNSNDDFELHIVSPNYFNNKSVVIKLRNIEYHFYRRSFIWPNRLNYWVRIDERSNYNLVKRIVGRIIRKIQPDIIIKGSDYNYKHVVGSKIANIILFKKKDNLSTTKILKKIRKF